IYGQREFFTANGKLQYQHQLAPEPYQLIPMTNNRFRLEEDMIFDFQFMAEENASAVKVRYRDGRTDFNDKDSS
nr:hypothetical protein [candidate division Zixibacteria bacterium]NIT53200.1 hypothetical protein [candidate division Zixibacteria bacterium]NIU14602.1 hypothetical protein [candidate division Zixibacteria bacterium]